MTENSISYDELEERVKRFLGYERKLSFLANGLAWVIFPFSVPIIILSLLSYSQQWQLLSVLVITNFVWFLCAFWIRKKARTYWVQDNEWVTFYCHSILESLAKRLKARTNELKTEYQKEASKYAEDFLSRINKRWIIGNFQLVQEAFAYPLYELKKNLEYRVIPRAKTGTEEEIGKVGSILANFLILSQSLRLEDIISINKSMSELPTTEPMKLGVRNRIRNYLSSHRIAKDAMVIFAFLVGCGVSYYVVVTYVGISKNYAFAGVVAVFVGLLTIYYLRPKS